MKKNMFAFAATLALAFATVGSAPAAIDSGDIYEFKPITPVTTSSAAFGSAQTVQFLMRLISPDAGKAGARRQWQIYYKPDPFLELPNATNTALIAWAMSPLRIGVVVSGQTRGCALEWPTPYTANFSDVICTYETKDGDLALPMKLAKDANGGTIGDGKGGVEGAISSDYQYYFENNGTWGIGYVSDDGKSMVELKPFRCQDPKASTGEERNGSYDLAYGFGGVGADQAYFIKTVGFDNQSYNDGSKSYWRMVHEGSTTPKPDVAKIHFDNLPDDPRDQYVYLWSEDDSVVTLQFTEDAAALAKAGVTQETFKDREGNSRAFWVKKIKVDGKNADYSFQMRGLTGKAGNATRLVMSTTPHYNFDGTGDVLTDYLAADVLCGERLKPTITVKVNGLSSDTVNAVPRGEIATPVATMTVSLSEAYPDGTLAVKVLPKLAKKGVAGESAIDYFGMSFKTEPMSYNDKETNLVFKADEPLEQTVFLYSWGAANDVTYGVDASVVFEPVVEDETARAFFQGGFESAYLMVKPIKPEIVEPEEGKLLSVDSATPYTIHVNVSDTFNDMSNTNGYELFWKKDVRESGDPVSMGFFKPDADGYLWSVVTNATGTSKEPEFTWTSEETEQSTFYLKSPESKEQSAIRTLNLSVRPARTIEFVTLDERAGNGYTEGEEVNVRITLKRGDEVLKPENEVYAFLVPLDEASSNAVSDSTWLAKAGNTGIILAKNRPGTVDDAFRLIDGTINPPKTGTTYRYKVELRTQFQYESGSLVPGYDSGVLIVHSQNVIPKVESVELNNGMEEIFETDRLPDGTLMFSTVVSKNVTNEFRLTVNEPGDFDKTTETKPFETKWIIRDKNGTATVVNPPSYGDPDTNVFYWAFKSAGTNTVEVQLKDKDMSKYGNGTEGGKFTFKIAVVDNPTISVTTGSGGKELYENEAMDADGDATLEVRVTMNPLTDEKLTVALMIGPTGAEDPKDEGVFELAESSSCKWMGSDGGTNTYNITFDEGALVQTVGVKTLDGTKMSRFPISVRAINEIDYPGVPGEKVNTYYKGQDTTIRVINVAPELSIDDISPNPAETNKTAIGYGPEISWDNIIDVRPDFEIDPHMIVKFTGGGGTTNIVITDMNNTAGSWAPYFKESGIYTVKMQVFDKDGGKSESFTFIYEVESSKGINIVAHGPASGFGSALGKRYSTASGLGEGRVWGSDAANVAEFNAMINGGLASKWYVYGYGYKVGDVDDGVHLHKPDGFGGYVEDYWTFRDVPIDGKGNKAEKIKPDEDDSGYYHYKVFVDKNGNLVDSFLYTWLQMVKNEEGSNTQQTMADAYLNNATKPEYVEVTADSGTPVLLPSEKKEDGTGYAQTDLEAVFSIEYLASDNMGDINQDGVPDIYVDKYGFGVVDPQTSQITAGADLESKRGFNEDEDYLPGSDTAYFAALIPGLDKEAWKKLAQPFTAEMEIRGYGEALNNAPLQWQIGLKNVKPDLIYTDPHKDKKSTLTPAEYLAWCEYAAAEHPEEEGAYTNRAYFADWSPERPTDPTMEDTDEDGFPDGYEYHYWYMATVGWIDAAGNHRRLTGRKYDPRNPGEGSLISSKTIAECMDPATKASGDSSSAQTRDSDNDGLPDLLEFYLGTDPFDFDSDGDGLPDGYELMIAGSNPLVITSFKHGVPDNLRNFDGDAMAIGSYRLEANVLPPVFNPEHAKRWTFAVIPENGDGDTDGVQWYATKGKPEFAAAEADQVPAEKWFLVKVAGDNHDYAVLSDTRPPTNDVGCLLVVTGKGYTIVKDDEGAWVRGWPVTLAAGTRATVAAGDGVLNVMKITAAVPEKDANACWIYGRGVADATVGDVGETAAEYGCLALGRQLEVPVDAVICALPKEDRDVAFLHYLCYQEFGFDPRTAWSATSPVAPRWGVSQGGESVSDVSLRGQGGYVGHAARTREYTAYDEFLVYSFFLNNGVSMGINGPAYRNDPSPHDWATKWGYLTTNPSGPGEVRAGSDSNSGNEESEYFWGREMTQGADTDNDGVPDGWELYVMAGPKTAADEYVFAPPYEGFATAGFALTGVAAEKSYWSPFLSHANSTDTSNPNYLGGTAFMDGLNELREFSGTDSCAHYADEHVVEGGSGSGDDRAVSYSSTILQREDQDGTKGVYTTDDSKWLNKFFPTDPWDPDTDDDGLKDDEEGGEEGGVRAFVYGKPYDDRKIWSVPGGGLNPCSVDTDVDGLPDGWEQQFGGSDTSVFCKDLTEAGARDQAHDKFGATYLKDEDDNLAGNALDGLTDGMDGSVPDAFNMVYGDVDDIAAALRLKLEVSTNSIAPSSWFLHYPDGRIWSSRVNRDYDHDGLDNWQEYLIGTMRCWRYDDPFSPFDLSRFSTDMYCKKDDKGQWKFDLATAVRNFHAAGYLENAPTDESEGGEEGEEGEDAEETVSEAAAGEFWYKTLLDSKSPIYNPSLAMSEDGGVAAMSPGAQYFTPLMKGWDPAYMDPGNGGRFAYYHFYHRLGDTPLAQHWGEVLPGDGKRKGPIKYISCSPIDADTDHDGLDDYYELFHGMNPLLGESGKAGEWLSVNHSGWRYIGSTPLDIVFDGWGGTALEAWGKGNKANYWQVNPWKTPRGNVDARTGLPMDFEVFPWLNGLQTADPDGDDIRNVEEGIMPKMATTTWHHTDPTPLWMTDSSYTNSLVTRFFRMPTRLTKISLDDIGESFVDPTGATNRFCDIPGYFFIPMSDPKTFLSEYQPEAWGLSAKGKSNWMVSFEQNEGFDSDHDALPDGEETSGKYRAASDPLDADSPKRRQAMYFQGETAKSVLQTMPFVREQHPHAHSHYPDELEFLTYTVECWVKPDAVDRDMTIVERAIWSDPDSAGYRELMRKNFQLGIKDGYWYTKYDTSGTLADDPVNVIASTPAVAGKWTHLAATYDGANLTLYVNGTPQQQTPSNSQPEHGESAYMFYGSGDVGGLNWDYEYDYIAIIVGASARGKAEVGEKGYETLDLCNGKGLVWNAESGVDRYRDYYQGYVDEIRIWDGARTGDQIRETMHVRYTRELALENRTEIYSTWKKGMRRYAKDESGLDYVIPAELRYHFHFDSVPGAADGQTAATAPHGYDYYRPATAETEADGKAFLSRPEDYRIGWFEKVLQRYPGTVYCNPAWVTWVPNTVAHLPRYDGTTLDSRYWSVDFTGPTNAVNNFARSSEPVSLWTQYAMNNLNVRGYYRTTSSRHFFVYKYGVDVPDSTQWSQFEFTGRHSNQQGDDLIPLGGAYVRYCEDLWDGLGATTTWEVSRNDSDNDGMSDDLEEYIRQNYCTGELALGSDEPLKWDTIVNYHGMLITAGEAYRRELAKGVVETKDGVEEIPELKQVADTTGSRIPDWWEDLYNIVGLPGTADTDNDGLNNRAEYLVTEVYTNFNLRLNPRMPKSDALTNDYFRTVGRLYLGEMFTDHDLMEDHWEHQLADPTFVDANAWDALRDADEDGWTNFDENRYNGYALSTLAKLISHAVGDLEVLDAPTPTIRLKVRYNEPRELKAGSGEEEQADGDEAEKVQLVVQTFTDPKMLEADATFKMKPGTSVAGELYFGSWEERVVRGNLAPGYIDLASVDVKHAQIPRSEMYSWTDENGLRVSKPYAEFKEALAKNPDIIQNIQNFEWRIFEPPANPYTSADRAVTVDEGGNLNFYGERVGHIDLLTGDFEFDFSSFNKLSFSYLFEGAKGPAAGIGLKEFIYKVTYTSKIPDFQRKICDVSLAKPDKGFVKGGRNAVMAYYDLAGDGYTPGTDPMGVIRDVDVGWNGADVELELTTMSAVTPRVDLWSEASDRSVRTEASDEKSDSGNRENQEAREGNVSFAPAAPTETRVRVLRYRIDDAEPFKVGVREARVIFDRVFQSDVRNFIHEGDILRDGEYDLDWTNLANDMSGAGISGAGIVVTNVDYLIVFGDGKVDYDTVTDTNKTITAHPVLVSRRFERNRTAPTAVQESAVCTEACPTFSWRIDNEDIWASRYGTTYTAFQVKVFDAAGRSVYESGYQRMPAPDSTGVYSWTAPLYVDTPSPTGTHLLFANLSNYTWQVFTYNAKFKTDASPSAKLTFRMNVTTDDASSFEIPVKVAYAGPAKTLSGRVHVQAFTTPDFVGEPVSETVLDSANGDAKIRGLRAGAYFIRAYIDTDRDFRHSGWESWGYLNGRDVASVGGNANIFTPVAVTVGSGIEIKDPRTLYIEDCDTNGNRFPDVWEAEDNRGRFDPNRVAPVSGDAELIRINPKLVKSGLTKESQFEPIQNALRMLNSVNGVALMTGIAPADVFATAGGFEVKSEVDPETLTIVGFAVDAAQNRVLLKVGAETTANVDAVVANFLNITVRKGAEVTVKVERADSPNGPWSVVPGVGGTVTVDRAGADIEVKLDGELPAQGYFRAKIEE